jgi:hypothetical protein
MNRPSRTAKNGFALPMTIIAMAGIVLLLLGLVAVLALERKTARSYSDAARAELAAESGAAVTIEQITNFLNREDVGGAAFATWAYHPGGDSVPGHHVALTANRPQFDDGTTAGTPFLNAGNTTWLGTIGEDPDKLFADFQAGSKDVFNFNAKNALGPLTGASLARWQNFKTDPEGRQFRYAVWVDDETSRLDVTQIGTRAREDGIDPAEIPFFAVGRLPAQVAAKQSTWRTADSARIDLGDTQFPQELSHTATAFSRGYDVIAHAPSYAVAGTSQKNGIPLPLRGRLKRNLNWNGHLAQGNAEERVERLTEWMATGAEGFFNKRNLDYWPTTAGTAEPNYQKLPSANPFAADLRREQFRTIAASLIDYLDPDNTPTQPASLAALDYGNPAPGTSPVFLMRDVPRPGFFGADRTIRINEFQVIWNSRGAPDNFQANTTVTRTSLPGGRFRYQIPVTYRFELWNMDANAVPATSYEVRTTYMQQILGATFGAIGAQPIPEETEMVLPLNSGNPIGFAPNEVKVFDITRIYVRDSTEDRGTTWTSFRNGGAGTGDDQPDGHQRQSHVLLDAATGEWLHATTYLQMAEAPSDGVNSAGLGNQGNSDGNRLNDPRMAPLRMYDRNSSLNVYDAKRDWAGNKSASTIGTVNNSNSFNYQDFNFWLDRPHLLSLNNPLQGVTRIENQPMRSVAELGRIFDPSWSHPAGRGATNSPINRGVISPFRGGGTLAIGQASIATTGGRAEADHLDAKPWNIMDVFTVTGDGTRMNDEEFGELEWRGRVNLNNQKSVVLNSETKTNHELVLNLPSLRLGAAGRPTRLDFKAVATELKNRLTKGATRPDNSGITDWKRALPLFSPGQLSELQTWSKTTSFTPSENSANNDLKLLNRSDYAREEAMMRAANLVTTRSHCYRIFTAGEVLDPTGRLLARRVQENVIFFNCTWNADTGELESVKPEILYVRSL